MKLVFFLTFSFTSSGQAQVKDSLSVWLWKGIDFSQSGDDYEAAVEFSKIIAVDSTLFKIYLLRGRAYLLASESQVYNFNGKLVRDWHDTILATKGILDYKKGIQMFFQDPKEFPEEIVGYDEEYVRPTSYELGGIYPDEIFEGVLIYITTKGRNKESACDLWEKAKMSYSGKVELLINEFCK